MEGWADKQELRNLNNFSSMAGVVAGLNSAPITRLKRTKELLSAKTVSLKANLDATLDSTKNFANYKEMLKTINPPCVPFFGESLHSSLLSSLLSSLPSPYPSFYRSFVQSSHA
jgi:hypothetical protein